MSHWKSIHIERFRRLENLRLDGLGAVNLLVGKNNCGKTSVLEALAIASHPSDAFTWMDVGRERELKSARTPALEILSWFFPRTRPRENGYEGVASFSGTFCDGGTLSCRADYREFRQAELDSTPTGSADPEAEEVSEYAAELGITLEWTQSSDLIPRHGKYVHAFRGRTFEGNPSGPQMMPHQLISPVAHRTSRHLLAGVDRVLGERLKADLVRLMQRFAPDVEDIEIRSPEGRGAVIHLYHTGIGHVPLAVEGDGMRRALALVSAAVQCRGGVLLLDEIETALHPAALEMMFRALVQICRDQEVQVFATTHSLEAVDALFAGSAEMASELVVYRLPERGSGDVPKRFSTETLHDLRHEGGLDIR